MNVISPLTMGTAEQYRMAQLQVFNWGTFDGLHKVPVSERGYLFIGRSGAGKSTLLDAISTLLTPPLLVDYNAAARGADRTRRDRNLVSYIRGAWADQKDETTGDIATRYLRSHTTWSALALTYRNGYGREVSLVQIFWIRGTTSAPTDLRRHFLVFERAIDLREFESFPDSNFDVRRLKHEHPSVFMREAFRPYAERFCQLLGIESEGALKLLHRTQSAKNLSDLNAFFREFMLDPPETFETATRLVEEFGELNQAHEAVVTARRQIEVLSPARTGWRQHLNLRADQVRVDGLKAGIDPFRDERLVELLQKDANSLQVAYEAQEGEVSIRTGKLDVEKAALRDLERERRDAGGDRIEGWQQEKSGLESFRDEKIRRRSLVEQACRGIGEPLPSGPEVFAKLADQCRSQIEDWQAASERTQAELLEKDFKLRKLREEFDAQLTEVRALERQPSNIPSYMLELRDRIASAIGIGEAALPFVGELIEVKAEEQEWRGAIERVLRGFAMSVLVDERTYQPISQHVNQTHLGQRLVYHRITRSAVTMDKHLSSNALPFKIEVKAGPWSDWLQGELRRHFDHACVDGANQLKAHDKAVTREGQIKQGSTRHEKDDRRRIDDRKDWVLGFDNRDKLDLYKTQAAETGAKISLLQNTIDKIKAQGKSRNASFAHWQHLANIRWEDIDAAALLDRIGRLEGQIKELLQGNPRLGELASLIEAQEKKLEVADENLRNAKVRLNQTEKNLTAVRARLEKLLLRPPVSALTDAQREELARRFEATVTFLTTENIDYAATRVTREIGDELGQIGNDLTDIIRKIEDIFAEFLRLWPADGGGLDKALASTPDFIAKLEKLEGDDLPRHEERFFKLLQSQSQQNLVALQSHLARSHSDIVERMEFVNESLAEVPFNTDAGRSSYLKIEVVDRKIAEVRDFRQAIQTALQDAFGAEGERSEERFGAFRKIVDKLAGQTPEHERWRKQVLDVRLHVEFNVREFDEEQRELEIYRGGTGKSGGQKQKLATTCLAAALRYQLGGRDRGVPTYAAVVLDEAFDKADNEFTEIAMNVFVNFGFQMVVATPLKSVMTLEPFIGGACFVEIADRKHSGVLLISIDETRQRLDLPERVRRARDDENT